MASRSFEPGEIVRVPFPYTDRSTRQRRPALIVSDRRLGNPGSLVWVLMITALENAGWPGDLPISEPRPQTGLPIPSVIRTAKIASVDAGDLDSLGHVSSPTLDAVRRELKQTLGLGP